MRIVLVLFLLPLYLFAQEKAPERPSPLAIAKMKYKDTYLKITYSRPHKNGREIFGGVVPYGKIWQTGDNEATEITITDTVLVAGDTLPTGTYSIFSIPGKEKWSVIFNKEVGQWGSYNYVKKSDVFRSEVPSQKLNITWEPFTIEFEQSGQQATIVIKWDKTMVKIPLQFLH